MAHDAYPRYRFFAYLSLFTFSMLMLVTADNLLQLFFGWEGVGLCSYLLIGYWYDRPAAYAAAIKAFIVNRIGDLGFAIGIALVFLNFGSLEFDTIFAAVAAAHGRHLSRCSAAPSRAYRSDRRAAVHRRDGQIGADRPACLAARRDGRPDAGLRADPCRDDGHRRRLPGGAHVAAVRIRAGRARHGHLIGGTTALFAATIGCVQNDIKRVIAYSTCSQLGYMFIAAGVGAYQASIFHLMTHAFFKALLFLGAGSVIHAMSDEQDMRKMGGLWRLIPWTYAVMWIGSLALAGIPPFAGYYSKDAILEAA